jgi:DNA-directed RNA polymerase subunit E'/Rpb7
MKITSSYIYIVEKDIIQLKPYHMNSDILNNMLKVLKNKIEKKCNKNGYIDTVYKIVNYSEGIIPSVNLNAAANYEVSYECKIYMPIENSIIIGLIRIINPELIIAVNGPILIFIVKAKDSIDTTIWNIFNNYENKINNKKLAIGDHVKIHITDKKINKNDVQIIALGKLLDYATEDEINTYFISKDNNFI